LKLFYHKGGARPLFSIRHTYAIELYKIGTTVEDIAELMNTSSRMILNVYLGHTDQSLIDLAKRVPNKFKLVK
jgi:integrase